MLEIFHFSSPAFFEWGSISVTNIAFFKSCAFLKIVCFYGDFFEVFIVSGMKTEVAIDVK